MAPEQVREIGYQTVDLLIDQLTGISIPAMRRGDSNALRRALSEPPPSGPHEWKELLEQTGTDVLTPMSRLAHLGYFAFIPASSVFPAALGDLIAISLDIDVGSTSARGCRPPDRASWS